MLVTGAAIGRSSRLAAAGDPAQPYVVGLSALTPIGTCFNMMMPSKFVDAQPCSDQHEYELINLELASGANSAYPADSYWSGIVQDLCNRELQSYLGSATSSKFGDGRGRSTSARPGPAGRQGTALIYCVAHSTLRQAWPAVSSTSADLAAGSTG